jgi:large subunit ribosomal protein L10
MPTPQKEAIVEDLISQVKESQAIILTEYRGLTVSQVSDLRKKLRASDTTFAVVKNTLLRRAADGIIPHDDAFDASLNGPTAVAFANRDAIESSKAVIDYIAANRNTPLKIKGAIVDGRFYDAKGVDALSKVPPRDTLIAMMLGAFNSPITGLVGTLNGIISNFVFTLQAVADQKQAQNG